MDVQAVAGPSSRPYGPTAYESAAAEPSRMPNGVGSTSNGTSRLQNGFHDAPTTDNAANDEPARVKKTSATFHTSDNIVSKAIHKKPRTGYCYSTKMQMHKVVDPSDDEIHPETPERIAFIFKKLQETGTLARMDRIAIREAVKAEASLVHAEELWDTINSFSLQPHEFFLLNQQYFHKLSLYVNEHTAMCARLSLGGVIETCRAVAEERVSNAFAIVRPPGHHAEPEQSMGFCFYNNVAVAAAYIKTVYKNKGIRKILILDWDVHHGNGTQKAFWDDPDILYISIHRHEGGTFYPGTDYGGADMIGGPNAKGGCVNVPWDQAGATDADYLYAFQKIVMPIAYEFAPDFVIVSAGFDAAEGDQLGGCHVSPAGYGHMTHMLSSLANGRLVVALEGGYNIDAIAASALECVKVLLGEIPPQMPSMRASEHATEAIHEVQLIQSRYWNSIQPTSMSKEEMQDAGPVVPVTEILKAHRTHHLWDKYKLYNVPISVPALEEAFKDQLLITDNVFKAKTIVLYVHDMGNLRAELKATSADIVAENSFLIDTSSRIVEWTTDPLRDWALIDVNILAHSGSKNMITREAMLKKERALVLHIWDHIVHLSTAAQNVVLVGQAAGCHAIINLLNERSVSCMDRVRAAVQIFDMQKPPIIAGNDRIPGLRAWFHDLSMAIFPADHSVLADEGRVGKRYGKVFKSKDPRPSHVLSEWLTDIQRFLVERLNERLIPIPAGMLTDIDEDVTML